MNQISKLPDIDGHVLPERNTDNEVYNLYRPKYP
jgi:hypothetical protein